MKIRPSSSPAPPAWAAAAQRLSCTAATQPGTPGLLSAPSANPADFSSLGIEAERDPRRDRLDARGAPGDGAAPGRPRACSALAPRLLRPHRRRAGQARRSAPAAVLEHPQTSQAGGRPPPLGL
ncbi:hypothetical protein ACRAWF_12350 [Streptomyces sp. L7]